MNYFVTSLPADPLQLPHSLTHWVTSLLTR